MRRFHVGEVVTWIPDLLLRSETHGDYRIVAAMPDRDGDHMYRIKSPLEEYERVVKEGLLVKSNGYLPEETPARVSRHSSITLPTLQPGVGEALRASFPRSGVVAATVAAIACVAITRTCAWGVGLSNQMMKSRVKRPITRGFAAVGRRMSSIADPRLSIEPR